MSETRNPFDDLLTFTEACEEARTSAPTLRRWSREGLIPKPFKFKRRAYYRKGEFLAALDAMLRAKEKEASA